MYINTYTYAHIFYTKNYKKIGNAESGRSSLPQGKHNNWLIQYESSILKTYIQITSHRLNRSCL